ncbi:hypothetical protein RHSIM_Rhsim06G0191700 [Rhododendron simsii]|uniref:B box-type domain-containing protein n=1 Tax=Rhododendron simsii TaxID=118357 RepID=A0A834LL56_RHOSS|nr:hypothetical protein RHSIM_Rhsim06G0191700 [Rhododendron simsii]
MKRCELCSNPARIYCEADGARLCSNCDDKVHSANFLVAKHSRNLLCRVCQSQTPWKASGTKLGPTVSVCSTCFENSSGEKQGRRGGLETEGRHEGDETNVEFGGEECSDDEEDGELSGSSEDEDEEEGDNQVVPWSFTSAPPPVASSSSSEAVSSCGISSAGGGTGGVSALKRTRGNADLDSEDEIGSISSRFNHNIASMAAISPALENDEGNASGFFRSVKSKRPDEAIRPERVEERNEVGSRSVAMVVNSLRKLQQNTISDVNNTSGVVLGIYRLSKDPAVV